MTQERNPPKPGRRRSRRARQLHETVTLDGRQLCGNELKAMDVADGSSSNRHTVEKRPFNPRWIVWLLSAWTANRSSRPEAVIVVGG